MSIKNMSVETNIRISQECAEYLKEHKNIDLLEGYDSADIEMDVTQYDDGFGTVPYESGTVSVTLFKDGKKIKDSEAEERVRKGLKLLKLNLEDAFVVEKKGYDDLCDFLREERGIGKFFCVTIECVERAVNSYVVMVPAESKEDAIRAVQKEIDSGIGEVFSKYSVIDEQIEDVYETTEERVANPDLMQECNKNKYFRKRIEN